MMTGDLVCRRAAPEGILYYAGESAALFLDSLRAPYLMALKERAEWLVAHLENYHDNELDALMQKFFDNWIIEFQNVERSLGVS